MKQANKVVLYGVTLGVILVTGFFVGAVVNRPMSQEQVDTMTFKADKGELTENEWNTTKSLLTSSDPNKIIDGLNIAQDLMIHQEEALTISRGLVNHAHPVVRSGALIAIYKLGKDKAPAQSALTDPDPDVRNIAKIIIAKA